ncbi:DUF4127 family protein [Azotosporobacter soli]|uniref:DUF4127 family protein n=1 Tax=Azotosporobacter soli TaxID=3055040 RepID=UPI0031FEE5FD
MKKRRNKQILCGLVWFLIGVCGIFRLAEAAPLVLFVPLDDRPVCLADTLATARAAGLEVHTPPQEWLSSRDHRGDPDKIWQWLKEEAPRADAAVVSLDSLIYGGLVPSRTHELDESVLALRRKQIEELKTLQPSLRLYAFSTLMRSPKASAGGVDASYYEVWGPDLFRLGALTDKQESDGVTQAERAEITRLSEKIPSAYLADWRQRRVKNLRNNLALWDMTQAGAIDYLLLGRDDAWMYSDSRRDLRWLLAQREGKPDLSRFATMAAADQLGMLLMARAVNHFSGQIPFVAAVYGEGSGKNTVPSYQDETAGANVAAQIWATGAFPVPEPERAELVLAVHTLADGKTKEASSKENSATPSPAAAAMAGRIANWLAAGRTVAVADIAYANGADNGFMTEMQRRHLLGRLAAYGGWNTASNSAGFALSQGMLAARMESVAQRRLLLGRFLDDWAYQANVRQQIIKQVLTPASLSSVRLGERRAQVEAQTTAALRFFAAQHFPDLKTPEFQAEHPWDRMFEVKIIW